MMVVSVLLAFALGVGPQPGERYAPGQIMVQVTPDSRGQVNSPVNGVLASFGIPELDALNAAWHVTRIEKTIRDPHPNERAQHYGLDLLYLISADPKTDVAAMIADYERCSRVVYAAPNSIRPVAEVPNDPRYYQQWHLRNIQAEGAWGVSHGDSNVLFGVVDQGLDYLHPDIAGNVWVNDAEDINHNGRFDPWPSSSGGDLDDYDQDGNGYNDDVIGYDFYAGDPDPMELVSDGHGTHCWGVVNAVTNNAVGIASIAWGCRGFAFRCGEGGGIYINPAIMAIYYAIDKGAWVTSHSYGSSSGHPGEQAAMEYAWDSGELVCAAAGNLGTQTPHYPGAYDVCIGISASDANNHRCSWSNYGTWVELASPGTGILSTIPDSNYVAWDGTSMATPLTAGLACLVKSANPSMTNEQCRDWIFATCDSMPDPDYRAGLLGHGRINAMKALGMNCRCYLKTTATHLNDPNHNGVPEPSELCGLSVTLHNDSGWQTGTGVAATLTCTDPDIVITKSSATFPDIPGGSSGNCAADSFLFTVTANAVPHAVRFLITKTASPANLAGADTVTLRVGMPRILLVDDYSGTGIARWYREACDSLKTLYDEYSTQSSGPPSSDTLRHYPIVVWFTGLDSTNLLSSACRTALASLLDNGGKLFICGQNIGQTIGADPFYTNYLKAQFVVGNTGKLFNLGLPGDTIGHGDTIVCGGASGANNCKSPDGIRPTGGALGSTIYKDYADTTVYGAIHYRDGFRVVYLAIPFEAIDNATSRYVQKWTIMRRIMGFFDERLPGAVAEDLSPVPSVRGSALSVVPNPATSRSDVRYQLVRPGHVTLCIYDVRGRLVKTLVDEFRAPGRFSVAWNLNQENGRRVAEGIYFCTLETDTELHSAKLLVTR